MTVARAHDASNRVSSVNNTLGGATTRNYSYVYDNASRRTSETGPRGEVGYSNRNEVNAVTEPSGSPFSDQSFSYDAGYNRSNWTNGITSTAYTVNNLNQYTAVATATPSWNGDGGLSSYNGNTYTYDALMRLTEVDNAGGKYLFGYDPLGRRTKKVIESPAGTVLQTYSYHYDGSEVAVEYQPSATWTYYLGLGIDQPVMRINGTTKQWYDANAQGSISAVADNSGNLLEAYEYNAQGQVSITNPSGTVELVTQIDNNILYTGRSYDFETGNYFYRARYYSPDLGRFISRDPLSGAEFSQGTNLYAYCRNNFLNMSDPLGLFTEAQIQQGESDAVSGAAVRGMQLYDLDQNNMAGYESLAKGAGSIGTAGQTEGKSPTADGFENSVEGMTTALAEFAAVSYETIMNGEMAGLKEHTGDELLRQLDYLDWLEKLKSDDKKKPCGK